jgi:hypothetical protein
LCKFQYYKKTNYPQIGGFDKGDACKIYLKMVNIQKAIPAGMAFNRVQTRN